jgi:hypothetical protein
VCFKENIVPKYAVIKVTGNAKASTNTKQKARRLRIQNKIKYLYKKKQQINKELYYIHLCNANQWQNLWTHIEQNINDKLHLEIGAKLKNQTKKIHHLKTKNFPTHNNNTQDELNTQFYTRVVNNANITFLDSEITL